MHNIFCFFLQTLSILLKALVAARVLQILLPGILRSCGTLLQDLVFLSSIKEEHVSGTGGLIEVKAYGDESLLRRQIEGTSYYCSCNGMSNLCSLSRFLLLK